MSYKSAVFKYNNFLSEYQPARMAWWVTPMRRAPNVGPGSVPILAIFFHSPRTFFDGFI